MTHGGSLQEQHFVGRPQKRSPRRPEGFAERVEHCGIPVQMRHDAIFHGSVRHDVFHAVGKPHHVRADEFGPAYVGDVKLRRRPQVRDIPNKLHDDAPRYTAPPLAWAAQRRTISSFVQSRSVAHIGALLMNLSNEKVGRVFALREKMATGLSSYAHSHGAHVAANAAATQNTNPISPAISMSVSVRCPNVAGGRCEANKNTHNSVVKFNFLKV